MGNRRDLNISKKINKIMKISQEDAILIKNLYLSKQCGAWRLLSELPDRGWKLGSIDSLLKRIHTTVTIALQPGSGRPRSSRSSGGPCAQTGGQTISSWDFAWNWHSPFKFAHENSQRCLARSRYASNDVVFSCCLKLISNRVAHLTPWYTTLSSAINIVIVLL